LLIKEMSGESFWSYVKDKYLRPLGLHMDVLPERAGRDGRVFTSVKDGDGNLRLIAYKVQADGQIERIGTGVAGEISRIASSCIRRNGREFRLTAVRDSESKLRMISWELD
jgi:CubicO group peptidase (beta-lactamase class C family)